MARSEFFLVSLVLKVCVCVWLQIFRLVVAVSYMGNIKFETVDPKDPKSDVVLASETAPVVEVVSRLLDIQPGGLASRLTGSTMKTREGTITKPFTMQQALANRDSIAKNLYDSLFGYVVKLINGVLYSSYEKKAAQYHDDERWIGILDVFGFENFMNNSFEQFCINFCNERLQQFFNNNIIKSEQAEYKREAINWMSIQEPDSKEVLELIGGRNGIIQLLEQQNLLQSSKSSSPSSSTNNSELLNRVCANSRSEEVRDQHINIPPQLFSSSLHRSCARGRWQRRPTGQHQRFRD